MTTLILSITSCSEKQAGNPLLEHFTTPHQTPPFDRIEIRHYEPAFDRAIEEAKQEIKAISTSAEAPDFENTIVALDQAGEKLSTISSIFFNLNSACTNEEMQQIAQRVSPKLTESGTFCTGEKSIRIPGPAKSDTGTIYSSGRYVEILY